jgi:hypothetical protein
MSVAKIQPSEQDWERIIENQRWLNELSAKEQRQEEQERLEAEEEERSYQLWRNSMGTPAYDPTSPSLASAHAAQEAEKKELAWQQENHRLLHDEKEIAKRKESLAFVQNLVRLMDSDAANRERERQAAIAYADALAAARARIDACPLSRKAYGPFAEDMIIAHAKCSVKFPLYSKEWDAELEKHDVIHLYRQWCWDKSSISISKGW